MVAPVPCVAASWDELHTAAMAVSREVPLPDLSGQDGGVRESGGRGVEGVYLPGKTQQIMILLGRSVIDL